jgi:uncharacterized protein (TIGR03067 family)
MMTRRWMAAALVGLLALAGAGLRADDEKKVEGDLKALEGDWVQDIGGHEDAWTFKGTNAKLNSPDRKYDMTIKIDEKAKPKSIDFKTDKGPEDATGKTLLAIYKIDGDNLTIALSITPDERPKEFKMEEGSIFVFELKRKKK